MRHESVMMSSGLRHNWPMPMSGLATSTGPAMLYGSVGLYSFRRRSGHVGTNRGPSCPRSPASSKQTVLLLPTHGGCRRTEPAERLGWTRLFRCSGAGFGRRHLGITRGAGARRTACVFVRGDSFSPCPRTLCESHQCCSEGREALLRWPARGRLARFGNWQRTAVPCVRSGLDIPAKRQ